MTQHEHLSEDALLDAVYGIAGSGAEAHVRGCPYCAQRLDQWHEKRAAAVGSIELSNQFLAAQRGRIYERMERPARNHWWWAPGVAAACALVIGIIAYPSRLISTDPAPKSVQRADISDAQLFGEVYSLEQSAEPAAAAPARGLFEEQQ